MNHHTSRKLGATPPQPSPSIRIDGEGGKNTGFAEVFEIGNAGGDSLKNRDASNSTPRNFQTGSQSDGVWIVLLILGWVFLCATVALAIEAWINLQT